MLHWLNEHRVLFYWLGGASFVLLIGSLVVVPVLIIRIPPDYFAHAHRPAGSWSHRGFAARMLLLAGRAIVGVLLIVAGVAMLALPGQGLLTILVGFLLLDFPGKYRFEQWLVSRRIVLAGLNWLRKRWGRQPLRLAATA